jgi:hypothetical protein
MTTEKTVTCSQCKTETHWLAVFPNNLCLPCYEVTQENTTPQEMYDTIMNVFGGRK